MLRAATRSTLCALLLAGPAVSQQTPPGAARVLAFLASPTAQESSDPAVRLPIEPFSAVDGDVLVYRARAHGADASPRGLEAVASDGRRTVAPKIGVAGEWSEVRVPLWAGATSTRFEAVARWTRGAQVAYELDDVRIERADGTSVDLFRDGWSGGMRRVAGTTPSAGLSVVGLDDVLASDHVSTRGDVSDPWAALDLTALRALERDAEAVTGTEVPQGLVWTGPCVPMRFASVGAKTSFAARGQRIGLDPVDGGRFYEVWIAAVNTSSEELSVDVTFLGLDRERVAVPLRIPARGPDGYSPRSGEGHPGRGCVLLEASVASTASLASFQLPDDPRLRILAITVAWRRDGASDPRFRAQWLARSAASHSGLEERDRADLMRYLANQRAGASFGGAEGDEAADRALFDALIAADIPAFRTAIAERLAFQAHAAQGRKAARIDLVATLPRAEDGLAAALADGLLPADLPIAAGDVRSIAALAARDPAAFTRLRDRMQSGAWRPFGVTIDRASADRLGAEAWIRSIAFEQHELERITGARSFLARIDADVARLQFLPQILASAGIRVALLDGARRKIVAPVARFGAGENEILTIAPAMRSEGPLRFDATTWRAWTTAATSPKGRPPISVACDVSSTAARETLALAADLDASEMAPDLAWASLTDVAEAGRPRAVPLEIGLPPALPAGNVRLEVEARAAVRSAERELEKAAIVEALAALDGAPEVGARTARGWTNLFAAARLEPAAASRAAREIADRARTFAAERLALLQPAIPPAGPGVPLAILDPLPWARTSYFELASAELRCAGVDGDLPMQLTAGGGMLVEYAGFGMVPTALRVRRDPTTEPKAPSRVRLDGWTIRTQDLVIAIDPTTGRIARISSSMAGNEVPLLADGGDSLAWITPGSAPEAIDVVEKVEFVERGPLRAVARVVRTSKRARVETEIRVTAGAAGLELRSRVELLDRSGEVVHTLPLAHATANALISIPLGSSPIAPSDERRALDGWAAATDGAATFALLGENGTLFRWQERAFGVVLGDATSFRVFGRGVGRRPAGLDAVLLEHVLQPLRVAFETVERAASPREQLVRIARIERDGKRSVGAASGIVPLSVEGGPDGSIQVRVLETRGEAGQVEITFAREPFGALRVDALGGEQGSLNVTGRAADISIGAGQVQTLRARLSP